MKNHDQELFRLKEHMKSNNLLPVEAIIVDNQRHNYWITKNDLLKQAYYVATCNFQDENGPLLICSYSFIDDEKEFRYSSSNK